MAVEETPSRLGRDDIRPIVAPRSTDRSVMLFVGVASLGAGLLFYTLESRRSASTLADITVPAARSSDVISSPPPLEIPEGNGVNVPDVAPLRRPAPRIDHRLAFETAATSRSAPSPYTYPRQIPFVPSRIATPDPSDGSLHATADNAQPAVVFNSAPVKPITPSDAAGAGTQPQRVTATRFENPSTTVPKGTVVQAVLETALDSTRAGFARAIVSRDTFGFDGTQILIPRGSRLVGEYKADITAGQKRALIQWQQLMRPDGVVIHLDSPAADPLGRAGVGGKVNSHFLERFSGAILQSALSIGVELATRSVSHDSVIVAVPGSLQGVAPIQPERIQPTLKVKQGTSVSIFVSRDLDFTTVTQ